MAVTNILACQRITRHKVCEVHKKTLKVIVNGYEQRFCQQCSSCCRRLEGHNERRRKRQFNILSGKPHKLLQQYQANFWGLQYQKSHPLFS